MDSRNPRLKKFRVDMYVPDGDSFTKMHYEPSFAGLIGNRWIIVEGLNQKSVVGLIHEGVNILQEPAWITKLRRDGHMHWTAVLSIVELRR